MSVNSTQLIQSNYQQSSLVTFFFFTENDGYTTLNFVKGLLKWLPLCTHENDMVHYNNSN